MRNVLPLLTTALLLSGGVAAFAQTPPPAPATETRARTEPDVSYGRIKELTMGQKVVIDIDDAPDKTFELADKDVTVKLDKKAKVGDPVKISELSRMGKTHTVTITKHMGRGVQHGDKDANRQKQ